MQKAVVNAIVSSRINNCLEGMHELYMDNHCSTPELLVLLCEKYQILACGAIHLNRKGWNMEVMNLTTSSPSGASLGKMIE